MPGYMNRNRRAWLIDPPLVALATSLVLSMMARPVRAEPADRQVAEWVILMGGSVRLHGAQERIRELTMLPAADFRLELADLVGTNINPPDLERLAGLAHLKILNLPGPMWNPSANSNTDYSRELRHLASVRSLEELTFSYTYLESINFEDPGIEAIAALAPSLRLLSIENTQVHGRHLAALKNLESLDLVYCPVNDEGLKELHGLTKLRRLLLRDAVISDDGMRNLGGLVNLEQLDLGGTKITDAGIAHLKGMTKLKKLDLLGTALSDDGARQLAHMTKLEELNLYGTKITNVAIEVLKDLKQLKVVDLRYTRVNRAGVDRLRASVAGCDVSFLDPSVRPALPGAADRIVSSAGEKAVAEWVRAIGGQAVAENGKLLEISLAGTGVTDRLLQNLEGLNSLKKLALRSTEIGNLGVAQLAKLTALEELDLDGAAISDDGLAPLANLKRLRALRLSHTEMSGAGLKHLRGLPLEKLDLSSAPVTDRSLVNLSSIATLRDLGLAYTDVTDAGLGHLESLAALSRLDLGGTDIGDKALPETGPHDGAAVALAQLYARHRLGASQASTARPPGSARAQSHADHRQEHARYRPLRGARRFEPRLHRNRRPGAQGLGRFDEAQAPEPRQHEDRRRLRRRAESTEEPPRTQSLSYVHN